MQELRNTTREIVIVKDVWLAAFLLIRGMPSTGMCAMSDGSPCVSYIKNDRLIDCIEEYHSGHVVIDFADYRDCIESLYETEEF